MPFFAKKNQLLFQTMRELQKEGKPIDVVRIAEKLGSNILNVGGPKYIAELACCCLTTTNYEHYQSIVLHHYKLKTLKGVAAQFLNDETLERQVLPSSTAC